MGEKETKEKEDNDIPRKEEEEEEEDTSAENASAPPPPAPGPPPPPAGNSEGSSAAPPSADMLSAIREGPSLKKTPEFDESERKNQRHQLVPQNKWQLPLQL